MEVVDTTPTSAALVSKLMSCYCACSSLWKAKCLASRSQPCKLFGLPLLSKSQTGAAEEGGDPVLDASEVAVSAVVDGMDCGRLAKYVSALDEKKDLLKVASAVTSENALPLAAHHVNNFKTALKRMHPTAGKAVRVMCQCLNSQQFAKSGAVPARRREAR